MPNQFVPNPNFMPEFKRAVRNALDDKGEEIKKAQVAAIMPFSSSAAAAITSKPAQGGTLSKEIQMGKGLGPIFEFSKQQARQTQKGANRGVMARREFFNKARRLAETGLDLDRYL